jgi:hypothetical protein
MPMGEKERQLEEERHCEVVRRYREQIKKEQALVEQLHREAVERILEEEARGRALVEQSHREAVERFRTQPPLPPPEPQTVHYLEQPEPRPDDLLFAEWTTYRREAGRLLAEGKEGRYLLIKGTEIVGIWDTHEDASAEGYDRFGHQPFLVHQLREREPVLRCISVRTCHC